MCRFLLLLVSVVACMALAVSADKLCRDDQYKYNVIAQLSNDFSNCANSTGYNFETAQALPSGEQREKICKKCDSLMRKVSKLYVPRCSLNLGSSTMTLQEFFGSILGECDYTGPNLEPLKKPAAGGNATSVSGSGSASDAEAPPKKTNSTKVPSKKSNATAGSMDKEKPKSKSKEGSVGSSFDIETPKPTKKPKQTKAAKTDALSSSGSAQTAENSTAAKQSTPAPTKSQSGASKTAAWLVAHLVVGVVSTALLL